jgi:hypothetical protein
MTMAGEDVGAGFAHAIAGLIGHAHVSEPFLANYLEPKVDHARTAPCTPETTRCTDDAQQGARSSRGFSFRLRQPAGFLEPARGRHYVSQSFGGAFLGGAVSWGTDRRGCGSLCTAARPSTLRRRCGSERVTWACLFGERRFGVHTRHRYKCTTRGCSYRYAPWKAGLMAEIDQFTPPTQAKRKA